LDVSARELLPQLALPLRGSSILWVVIAEDVHNECIGRFQVGLAERSDDSDVKICSNWRRSSGDSVGVMIGG
jgi:hypothetical protein